MLSEPSTAIILSLSATLQLACVAGGFCLFARVENGGEAATASGVSSCGFAAAANINSTARTRTIPPATQATHYRVIENVKEEQTEN